MSNNDIDGFLGGAPALKFPDVGTQWTITVTEMPVKQQQTDFDSGEPLFWDDGKPREQLIVTGLLDEDDRDDEDDEGERRLFVKSGLVKAFREALRDAKVKPSGMVGGRLTMTYTEDGPKPKRGFPPKIYEGEFVPAVASAADVDDFVDSGPAATESSESRSVQHAGNGKATTGRAKAGAGARSKPAAAAPAEDDEPPF